MTTQMDRINGMIEQMRAKGAAYGLSVRCPECNAGIGRWCRIDMSDPNSAIVKHEARVALASK